MSHCNNVHYARPLTLQTVQFSCACCLPEAILKSLQKPTLHATHSYLFRMLILYNFVQVTSLKAVCIQSRVQCFFVAIVQWRMLVLDYCKSEPEFFLCVIFCVYLLLYAGLRLLHLTVAQILYTIISQLCRIYILLKFLLTEFSTTFGMATSTSPFRDN